MKYAKSYGPSYRASKPDFNRCAESVSGDGWGHYQCQRKARYDPDAHGNPTTCKQHSEAATSERRAKQKAAHDANMRQWRLKAYAPKMKRALQEIADGHNDPRTLAASILKDVES